MVQLAPSILSADLSNLYAECQEVFDLGATRIHFDVMDGHFVPNLTFGAPVLKCLSKRLDALYDVHLMVTDPQRYLDAYADAGADYLTFHLESNGKPEETIARIRSLGMKPGMSLRPNTPIEDLFPFLDKLDLVLVMSVEPGFGGQGFLVGALDRIRALRAETERRDLACSISVDGGINPDTAKKAVSAGADVLVAGSSVFGTRDRRQAIGAFLDGF